MCEGPDPEATCQKRSPGPVPELRMPRWRWWTHGHREGSIAPHLIGAQWNITEEWAIIAETNLAFSDRQQFMMQLGYRF